ncbi:MAG: OsmC family protein [Thiocapsa sp.]|nr:OsmC family protein [Thiocapsa sp.]MCG6986501.1 OsmC family protein [Thiocapsa sp.]
MPKELNGWSVEALRDAVNEVEARPEAGLLTWKSRVRWDGGFGLDVRPESIEQLGTAMPRHFTLRGDHPPELLGQNTGPTAIETLLAALGACMAGTFAAQATARGIELSRLEVEVEGRIDLSGFFGLRPVAPGISDIRLTFDAEAEDGAERLPEVLEATRALSPVFDTVTTARHVETRLAAAGER